MKMASSWLTLLLCVIVVVGIGCDGASTIIDDDGSGNQTIIIKRNASRDPFDANEAFNKAEVSDYSRLIIFHDKGESETLWYNNYSTGGRYDEVGANLYSVVDRENFVVLNFGAVDLGETEIPLVDTASIKYYVDGKVVPFTYQYFADTHLQGNLDDPDMFTGATSFSTSGGNGVQKISEELDLPARNLITNVTEEEVVDPRKDWVIKLKRPIAAPEISGIFIYNYVVKILENFANSGNVSGPHIYDGVTNVSISATEPTDTIVIPKAELQRLQNESEENVFIIKLGDFSKVGEVQLRDGGGSELGTLDVASHDQHSILFKFEE